MKTKPLNHFSGTASPITKKLLLFSLFLLLNISLFAQDSLKIKAVFSAFQSGYTKRDTSSAANFCNKLFAKDIFILGTGADEYVNGISAAKQLIKNDWAYWLNLSVDTSNVKWQKDGKVILFSVTGSAGLNFRNKENAYDFGLSQLNTVVNNEPNNRLKLLAYARESTDLINEIEKAGLDIRYKIRLTGVLVAEGNSWVFKQLVYSFPYPMLRE